MPATAIAWKKVPVRTLDPAIFGRVLRAYREPGGALLAHLSAVSRGSKYYGLISLWILCQDNVQIAVEHRYMTRDARVPKQWANQSLRQYRDGIHPSARSIPQGMPISPYLRSPIESVLTDREFKREIRERERRRCEVRQIVQGLYHSGA
jgi:hypothetical protein